MAAASSTMAAAAPTASAANNLSFVALGRPMEPASASCCCRGSVSSSVSAAASVAQPASAASRFCRPRATAATAATLSRRTCLSLQPVRIRSSSSRSSHQRQPERSSSRFVVRAQAETEQPQQDEKIPFGYTRKDVILIGVGLTALGFGLKYGLEAYGLDELQSGNVVQLVMVLGLCLGWVSTYLWRVGNKEMTYAKQLRQYEDAVMQKRLEQMPEAELEAMLAEIEEEKQRLQKKQLEQKQQQQQQNQ